MGLKEVCTRQLHITPNTPACLLEIMGDTCLIAWLETDEPHFLLKSGSGISRESVAIPASLQGSHRLAMNLRPVG